MIARSLLAGRPGNRQILLITDGEPTARMTASGMPQFHYPPLPETVDVTLLRWCVALAPASASTPSCSARRLRCAFVERVAALNRGRAFFATPENLGDYVLVDYLDERRPCGDMRSDRTGGAGRRARAEGVRVTDATQRTVRDTPGRRGKCPLRVSGVVCDNHTVVIQWCCLRGAVGRALDDGPHERGVPRHAAGATAGAHTCTTSRIRRRHRRQRLAQRQLSRCRPRSVLPRRGASTREARRSAVAAWCAASASSSPLQNGEKFGIWGGLSERERRRIRRQPQAALQRARCLIGTRSAVPDPGI